MNSSSSGGFEVLCLCPILANNLKLHKLIKISDTNKNNNRKNLLFEWSIMNFKSN